MSGLPAAPNCKRARSHRSPSLPQAWRPTGSRGMQGKRSCRGPFMLSGVLLLALVASGTWQQAVAQNREQHLHRATHWPSSSKAPEGGTLPGGEIRSSRTWGRDRGLRAFLAQSNDPLSRPQLHPGANLASAGGGIGPGADGSTAASGGAARDAVIPAKPGGLAVFDITSYGAKGDGLKDNSGAVMAAFNASCASAALNRPSLLLVPAALGMYRLWKALRLVGPCGTAMLSLQIDGFLYFDTYSTRDSTTQALLAISFMKGLTIRGSGTLHGQGSDWWSRGSQRPHLLQVDHSTNVRIQGLNFRDPPRCHVNIIYSSHVWIKGLTTLAPESSTQTDSIHVGSSQDVVIEDSVLHSGDDCVSIVGDTRDIVARRLMCTAGNGYSIGSLGYNGDTVCMANITIRDSQMMRTTNGARIKSYQGGKGIVIGVLFQNLTMVGVDLPIVINQVEEDAVAMFNIAFVDITATITKPKRSIWLNCSDTVPCSGVTLQSINVIPSNDLRSKDAAYMAPLLRNAFGTMTNVRYPFSGGSRSQALGTPGRKYRDFIRKQASYCGLTKLDFN